MKPQLAVCSLAPPALTSLPGMYPAITDLIPHRPPFLFVDEIVAAGPESLTAQRTWRAEEGFYQGHYPGSPITPGVLLCEAVIQTGAAYLALSRMRDPGAGLPILAKISDVRFRRPVRPGETTVMEVWRQDLAAGFCLMKGAMRCEGARVLNMEFSVTAREGASLQPPSPS